MSVILSDDFITNYRVIEKLGIEYQVCRFHVRLWVELSLYMQRDAVPKNWFWLLDEIKALLPELSPEGGHRLFEF